MRKLALLPLLLILAAVACNTAKPPPAKPPIWRSTAIDFGQTPGFNAFYCHTRSVAAPMEWSDPSALPDNPSQVLVILDPGHGGQYSGRSTHSVCGGSVEIDEDWVNLSLALRMQSFLERAGFHVDLSRYGYYGPFDDKHGGDKNANGCVTEALLGVRDKDVCEGPGVELNRRGRNQVWGVKDIEKKCKKHFSTAAAAQACVERATYIHHGNNGDARLSISRYGQIVREFKDAGMINVPFNPDGANLVGSPRVALISLHFNDATDAGAIFTSMIRGIGGGGSSSLAPNQAISKGSNPAAVVSRNLVTSTLEYMLRSLKDSRALPEAVSKHDLYYWDAGIVRNGAHAQEFDLHGRPGAVFVGNEHMKGKYQKPPRYAGPVTIASGLDPSYDGKDQISNIAPDSTAISIPNTTLIEVASYMDCANARALAQSLARQDVQSCYNSQSPSTGCPPPPDPTDPIDVTAEDIAHGLVEYYESYVPGFKQKACDNLKNSDWKDHMPDWCTSGGGGGGADVPDIDDVRPASIEVDVWMTDGAANPPVEVSFSNVGTADLLATISTDSPIASIGPPDVYPAGTAAPLGGSQSVRVPPGERARVEVGFQCTEVGDHTGSIAISSNDPDEREVAIGFTVHCISPKIGDELPAYQTAFNYIAPAGESRSLLKPPFDFYEAGGKAKLEFELEGPEWLHLPITQGELDPGARFSELLGNNYGEVTCGAVGEQEGYVIVRSNDPDNPEVQIPVRLMCPELEVVFNPDTYDDNLGLLSGVITVHGADHLKEMYARVVSDGNGGQALRYTEPRFVYKAKLIGYLAYRWPVLHAAGDEYSPWDWSTFPDIPFVSWVNSWAFDDGTHQIEEFSLYRPGAGQVAIFVGFSSAAHSGPMSM